MNPTHRHSQTAKASKDSRPSSSTIQNSQPEVASRRACGINLSRELRSLPPASAADRQGDERPDDYAALLRNGSDRQRRVAARRCAAISNTRSIIRICLAKPLVSMAGQQSPCEAAGGIVVVIPGRAARVKAAGPLEISLLL